MKKVFTTFLLVIVLCIVLVSCNVTNNNDTNTDTESKVTTDDTNKNTNVSTTPDSDNADNDSNKNESDTNTEKLSDTLVPNDDKDLDNQDILDTLVPNDEEFPFDTIIVERNGYDIVAAGKYYGNDFDNVKDYGSYYRIIDNYEDFSEFTQWGNQIDEAIFDENFVLVLYSYKNHYIYNSVQSQKGTYKSLKIETDLNELSI